MMMTGKYVSASETHVLKDRMVRRKDFVQKERTPPQYVHEVIVAVQQKNLNILEQTLIERSNPSSPLYQQWLNYEEVTAITRNPVSSNLVAEWLKDNGAHITWSSKQKEYIKASAPIATWERMLHTEFYQWVDESAEEENIYHTRSKDHSVPAHLAPHIHSIFNTSQAFPQISGRIRKPIEIDDFKSQLRLRREKKTTNLDENLVTPAALRSIYDIPVDLKGTRDQLQGIFAAKDQNYAQNDYDNFVDEHGLDPDEILVKTTGNITTCTFDLCAEGNLDVQYMMAMGQNVPTIYWYINETLGDPFLQFVLDLVDEENPPQVNSISYVSFEHSLSDATVSSFNTQAVKLGLMGVTLTASSGDDGVANFLCGKWIVPSIRQMISFNIVSSITVYFLVSLPSCLG